MMTWPPTSIGSGAVTSMRREKMSCKLKRTEFIDGGEASDKECEGDEQ